MNVRFERAFDDLILSHDVSDEAINRLYDGEPELVTPIDITYGLFCGNVAPDDMRKFMSRAKERRQESARKAEYYRRMMREQARIKENLEEAKQQKIEADQPKIESPMVFRPTTHVTQSTVSQIKVVDPQEIIKAVIPEFSKLVAYAESRIDNIERTIGNATITDTITGLTLDDARNEAVRYLQELKDNFACNTSSGWIDVISKIESGEITSVRMAIDYARIYKSHARTLAHQYDNLLRYRMNTANNLACGSLDDKHEIYDKYRELTLRAKRKPTLYVMKVMCETIGYGTMYNEHTGVLNVPIDDGAQYSPLTILNMTLHDYRTPLAITWATNTICDSIYSVRRMITYRHITGYYTNCLNSSDMLYVGYGMHILSRSNGNICPALVYEFHPKSTFPRSCKIIYTNECEMKRQGSEDPVVKEFYMKNYFHERNIRYAGFDPKEEDWEELADDIATFSTRMLAKCKGGAS